jgi:TolA-binding protein
VRTKIKIFFPYILVPLILVVLFSGCAYYNTFYNAKKFYGIAEKERKKRMRSQIVELSAEEKEQLKRRGQYNALDNTRPTGTEMQNYQKAIEKASKVLEFYPESRWVDDALMLLGECFYYRREYPKAQRKFEELIQLYPQSDFVPEARLLLAKTFIGLQSFDQAERRFRELSIDKRLNNRVQEEAAYELGGLYYEKENYEMAVDEYKKTAKESDDKLIRAMSYYRLGQCLIQLEEYRQVPEVFEKALDSSPNEDFASQSKYKLGEAYGLIGDYRRAIKTFSDLLSKEMDEKRIPMIKFQLAENLQLKGELEEAVEWYNEIIDEHKRTDASARSYFALAELEEYINRDYKKAKEYYDMVRGEFQNSIVTPRSKERSADIELLLELTNEIARLEGREVVADSSDESNEEDEVEVDDGPINLSPDGMWVNYSGRDRPPPVSLRELTQIDIQRAALAQTRTVNAGVTIDSLSAQGGMQAVVVDTLSEKEKEQKKLKDLAEKQLALAELMLIKFNKPDSAVNLYLNVLDAAADTVTSARALYSLAYTFEDYLDEKQVADSLYHKLVELYPYAPQAEGGRKTLGLPLLTDRVDSAEVLFKRAETLYMDDYNLDKSLDLYATVIEKYPDSPWAEKATYGIGWIYEHELYRYDQAISYYEQLLQENPQSSYAKILKPKIDAVAKSRADSAKAAADSTQLTDSQANVDSAAIDSSAITMTGDVPADSLSEPQQALTTESPSDSLKQANRQRMINEPKVQDDSTRHVIEPVPQKSAVEPELPPAGKESNSEPDISANRNAEREQPDEKMPSREPD